MTLWFVFVQCLVVLMLPVSLDCQLLIALWFVFVQCLVVLMLPVSPDCPLLIVPLVSLRSVSCGPNVVSVSGLSIIDFPFGLSSFSVLWS